MHYNLPPWSISILPDCKNTVYNTARVRKKQNNFYFRWLAGLVNGDLVVEELDRIYVIEYAVIILFHKSRHTQKEKE